MSIENQQMSGPCNCGAELIGLSDGSSVHGWKCSKCGHEWPRQITVRGLAKFRYVRSGGVLAQLQERWKEESLAKDKNRQY